jgi:hypothetical protein
MNFTNFFSMPIDLICRDTSTFVSNEYCREKTLFVPGMPTIAQICISPAQLVRSFGLPDDADFFKISGEYHFVAKESSDIRFEIYDWKSTSLYSMERISPELFWENDIPHEFNVRGKYIHIDMIAHFIFWLSKKIHNDQGI